MTNRGFNKSLALFSLIMVPCYAIFFGLQKSPFEYTFSMIGYWFNNRLGFIIWGTVTAFLLLIGIFNIYKQVSFKSKRAYRLLYASILFLVLSVITPTVNSEPLRKEMREGLFYFNLHGLFAALFAIFLLTSLFLFSHYLSITDNKKMSLKGSLGWLLIISGGSLIILFLFGMTGVFELFFFISLSVFLIVTTTNCFKNKKDL